MHQSSLRAAILNLALLASTVSATSVSLASFIPRINELPSSCATVYNAAISGCQADDFKAGATCTAECVRGLVKIGEEVKKSCADVDAGELSIIGVFQNGLGIVSLCPNIAVTSIASGSTSSTSRRETSTQAPVTTTSTAKTTSTPAATSSAGDDDDGDDDGDGDDEPTSTAQPSSSSSSSAALTLDPNATATFATSAISTANSETSTGPAEPTAPGNSQLSNSDSGGGSPFDVVATGSSPQHSIFDVTMAGLFATAVFFVACV